MGNLERCCGPAYLHDYLCLDGSSTSVLRSQDADGTERHPVAGLGREMAQICHYVQVPPLLVAPDLLAIVPHFFTKIVGTEVARFICFHKRAACAFLIRGVIIL